MFATFHSPIILFALTCIVALALSLWAAFRLPMKFGLKPTLSALLMFACFTSTTAFITGCSDKQKQTTLQVMQSIAYYGPGIVGAADTVAATVGAFTVTDPAAAALLVTVVTGFDTVAKSIEALAQAYIANPNADTLTQLQTAITTLESQVNTASLAAVKIVNPVSQQLAIVALKGLLTVVTIVFGLVQSTMTKAQLDGLASQHTIDLATLRKLNMFDEVQLKEAAEREGVPTLFAALAVDNAFQQEHAAGF